MALAHVTQMLGPQFLFCTQPPNGYLEGGLKLLPLGAHPDMTSLLYAEQPPHHNDLSFAGNPRPMYVARFSRRTDHPRSELSCRAGFRTAPCGTAPQGLNSLKRRGQSQCKRAFRPRAFMGIHDYGAFQGRPQLGLHGKEVVPCNNCWRRHCRSCCRHRHANLSLTGVVVAN